MNYCNEIEGFINYSLSNPKNIGGDGIRYTCNMCTNKSLSIQILYNASSTKRIYRKILVLVCVWKTICSLQDHGRKDDWVNF
jgi:hypothetical protein